jgi:cell division septal protein FtsQ
MRKQKINFPVKLLLSVGIILLALAFVMGYILKVLTTSEYFKVKDVISQEAPGVDFSVFKGKNIFSIDLPYESENIVKFCPDCLRVRLARVLPDRIFVEFIRRKPVALVRLYRYFAVDQYGVLFDSPSVKNDSTLPLITGLDSKIFGAKLGKRCEVKELILVLSIIREAKNTRLLRDYQIQEIRVTGVDDIAISIVPKFNDDIAFVRRNSGFKKAIEVQISQGNIAQKVTVMAGLLNQEKNNLSNIKYIDLRFKEPVIRFRDAK